MKHLLWAIPLILTLFSLLAVSAPQTATSSLGNITSDSDLYNCYPSCSASINVSVTNVSFNGTNIVPITVNNTAEDSGITWTLAYLNSSDGQWYQATDNDTTITGFNLTFYDEISGLRNQFRLNITLPSALSTKWNWSITVNGTIHTLDPYLDAIALANSSGITINHTQPTFGFTMHSDSASSQTCDLTINGTAFGQTTATTATATTIRANASLNASNIAYSWLVSCATTGSSAANTFTLDTLPPTIAPNISTISDAGAGVVSLTWATVSDAAAYGVWRSSSVLNNSITGGTRLATVTGTSYIDNTTDHGSTYWYALTSIDSAGNENTSLYNVTTGYNNITVNDSVMPRVPTNISLTESGNSVIITWSRVLLDVLGNSDSRGLNYQVWRGTSINTSKALANETLTFHENSTDNSSTYSFSSSGTYHFAVTATDDGGNANKTLLTYGNITVTYTAPPDDDDDDGGGGGGGGSTLLSTISSSTNVVAKVSRGWAQFAPGQTYVMPVSNKDIPITAITIRAINRVDGPSLEVSSLSDSDVAPALSSPVFRYLRLTVSRAESDDLDATIRFGVPLSWISAQGGTPDNVVLYRYRSGWDGLDTTLNSTDNGTATYDASTPGFSIFAVGLALPAPEDTETTLPENVTAPEPVYDAIEPEDIIEEPEEEEKGGISFAAIFWTVLILILVGGLVAYIIYAKKQK